MAAKGPSKLTLRVYQVGFGDCFLLTFHYTKAQQRHVLVDFGSTKRPDDAPKDLMTRIALDVKARCGGKLHAIVATHRHADHISGFATNDDGTGPGDVIRSLAPDVVVQPWTENPELAEDATSSPVTVAGAGHAFAVRLESMHRVAAAAVRASRMFTRDVNRRTLQRLAFVGEDNVKNLSAVRNLQEMGRRGRAAWVHHGSDTGLGDVLPGVKVRVLGPPTLEQTESIRRQRDRNDDEFWHLAATTSSCVAETTGRLFPQAGVVAPGKEPVAARWMMRRVRDAWAESLLSIVTILDDAMNNTSVILLLDVGKTRLLFPGDAQIENWSFALAQPGAAALLADVRVYKVGHHGSLNATPKSLWKLFARRKDAPTGRKDLSAIVSTLAGKHGSANAGTEVPRSTLMKALSAGSAVFTTQSLHGETFFQDFEIPLK